MTDKQTRADLEIRIAFLEDSLDTLDGIIARQAEVIAQLERANQRIVGKMANLEELVDTLQPREGGEPPPPHY